MKFVKIRSRHPSHDVFRKKILTDVKSVVRFGSQTEVKDCVEINTIEAIKNSSDKLKMKQCFTDNGVKTAKWIKANNNIGDLNFPIVAKNRFGSRGKGNTLIKNKNDFDNWLEGKNLDNYIFEKFYNYNKEYRLHITNEGCFYSCRKMLKHEFRDYPNSWQRHDDNCVWILEQNPQFEKPNNWNDIVQECIKALNAVKLDIGACDIRVQNGDDPKFIIIEINSAPSMGKITTIKYMEELPKIINKKYVDIL